MFYMLFARLIQFIMILNVFTGFCVATSQAVSTPYVLLNVSTQLQEKPSFAEKPLLVIDSKTVDTKSIGNKSTDNKFLLNPLRKMAEDVKRMIEEYTKRRNLVRKGGAENRYDELLKTANDLAKEIEAASNEHDVRMEQYQKGNIKSGEQAVRLTELVQSRTEPFNALLWRMDQVIAEIQSDTSLQNPSVPGGIAPTTKLVPQKLYKQEKIGDILERAESQKFEEESVPTGSEHKGMQSLIKPYDDLNEIDGQ